MAETKVNFDDGISISSNSADEATIRASFPAEPSPDEKPEPEGEKPPVEAKTAEPPKIDKRTREGKALSIQQQIDADTARKYTAKSEADAEEARLVKIRSDIAAASKPAEPREAAAPASAGVTEAEVNRYLAMPGAPDIEKYSSIPSYNFAVAAFVAEKRFEELTMRQEQGRFVREKQAVFQTRVAAEVAKDPTFQKRYRETPVDTRTIPYIHSHPQGPDIMVYLTEHPDIAQRLASLNPTDSPHPTAEQIGQIGEIAGELKARAVAASSGPARPPAISNAKPPIKPLGSSPNVSDDVDEADLSPDEFIRRGNLAERKRQQAGRRF